MSFLFFLKYSQDFTRRNLHMDYHEFPKYLKAVWIFSLKYFLIAFVREISLNPYATGG